MPGPYAEPQIPAMMVAVRLVAGTAFGFACILATASAALAHIGVTPGVLAAEDTSTLNLSVHNDIDRPMTGLAVTAPNGLQIRGTGTEPDWQGVVEDATATWTGGPLAPNTGKTFLLDVEVDAITQPGPVVLQAQQLYSGSGSLPWQISVTVIPAEDESQLVTWAIVGGVALLATAGIALLALRRRGGTLQEG